MNDTFQPTELYVSMCVHAVYFLDLSKDVVDQAVTEIKTAGYDCFMTSLGGPGVLVTLATADTSSAVENNASDGVDCDRSISLTELRNTNSNS